MQALFASYATTSIEDGTNILTWLQTLGDKYSDLPGVRNLHDFLFVKAQDGKVVLKVYEFCFGGVWNVSPLHQKNTTMSEIPTDTYKDRCWHQISDDKMAHMVTMYNGFIPPDRRPEFLPPIPVQSQPQEPAITPSIHSAHTSCDTAGCNETSETKGNVLCPRLYRRRPQEQGALA